MPLYPTEDIIWNENIVPSEYFSGEGCLALPKLNLQFLTLHDYLLRNFNLFRLESTCTYLNSAYSLSHYMITWYPWGINKLMQTFESIIFLVWKEMYVYIHCYNFFVILHSTYPLKRKKTDRNSSQSILSGWRRIMLRYSVLSLETSDPYCVICISKLGFWSTVTQYGFVFCRWNSSGHWRCS